MNVFPLVALVGAQAADELVDILFKHVDGYDRAAAAAAVAAGEVCCRTRARGSDARKSRRRLLFSILLVGGEDHAMMVACRSRVGIQCVSFVGADRGTVYCVLCTVSVAPLDFWSGVSGESRRYLVVQ